MPLSKCRFLPKLISAKRLSSNSGSIFDKRKKEPTNGKIFAVDLYPNTIFPKFIKKQQIHHIKHEYYAPAISDRMKKAQELLDTYRDKAKLVITRRLHCALPCVAMGIPVILLGDHEPHRLAVAWDFIPCYKTLIPKKINSRNTIKMIRRSLRYNMSKLIYCATDYRKIDWDPQPLDIEPIKKQIIFQVGEQIKRFT